jgi:type I restriction enzyme M protein
MLDTDTKRRIDTARDILVGKVPDPKSQVEQITIALIYKFMDDMDAESEELGGQRKFFAGDFSRYGWAKLMRSGLGGHETLNLYAEAIAKMPENPGIPPLFRDIFKNAYLPYRDPETLRAFLKIIDEFEYDHSERLGDAFEYLLSVLGSQGDAGQFRTPRHIIDFIVEVVDPQKHETILDPACGTAGFLISAYKHILRMATEGTGNTTENLVDSVPFVANPLTPDERERLAANMRGYDISPDMVRLSLVNMYLHGFAAPHIYEYDTLTSLERWNDYADVILANPPFMSPKGGIKPHNRFSVQSKRSEVLFVDYMAEHLTPSGRAGIIVPEGIIFQSQNAYKQLRKMLVEGSLVAVVSLPAGVFNPYSGVKTSILILDKALAKKTDCIAFFKVENDGFGLGAQRREIERNDLPEVAAGIKEYFHMDRQDGQDRNRVSCPSCSSMLKTLIESGKALIAPKEKIAANDDYNLSGERYRESVVGQTRIPMVPLGEVAELIRGITFGKSERLEHATEDSLLVATTKAAQSSGIVEADLYHLPRAVLKDDTKLLRVGDILISTANSLNLLGRTTHVLKVDRATSFGAFMSLIRATGRVLDGYLIHCLRTPYAADFFLRNANTTTNISNLNLSALAAFQIPLPPLSVQQEIVAEIEGYQKVIDGARAVVDHYRPHIPIDPAWPMVELGEVVSLEYGKPLKAEHRVDGPYPVYGSNGVVGYHNEFLVQGPAIIVGRKGSAGAVNWSELACYPIDTTFWVRIKDTCTLDLRFCYYQMAVLGLEYVNVQSGVPGLNRNDAYEKLLPLPPLETQRALVAEIEAEQALVAANRELIARMEKKIQATLARVWGE